MNPELRIGDAEREAAIAALGEHYAAGRLSKDEFDERTAVALTAPTQSALAPLFLDLPAPHAAGSTVSTTPVTVRPRPSRSASRTLRRRGWYPIPILPVIVLLVALRVADLIPWFVFGIVVCLWFFGRVHRSHHDSRYQSPTTLITTDSSRAKQPWSPQDGVGDARALHDHHHCGHLRQSAARGGPQRR